MHYVIYDYYFHQPHPMMPVHQGNSFPMPFIPLPPRMQNPLPGPPVQVAALQHGGLTQYYYPTMPVQPVQLYHANGFPNSFILPRIEITPPGPPDNNAVAFHNDGDPIQGRRLEMVPENNVVPVQAQNPNGPVFVVPRDIEQPQPVVVQQPVQLQLHWQPQPMPPPNWWEFRHYCTECYMGFTDMPALVEHQRIQPHEEPSLCTPCEKVFRRRDCFQRHLKTLAHIVKVTGTSRPHVEQSH